MMSLDKKDLDSQVVTLNETILNVFRNYVPNKYITIDDKDPVWMNQIIKSKMETKSKLYQQYIQNGRFESNLPLLQAKIIHIGQSLSHFITTKKFP